MGLGQLILGCTSNLILNGIKCRAHKKPHVLNVTQIFENEQFFQVLLITRAKFSKIFFSRERLFIRATFLKDNYSVRATFFTCNVILVWPKEYPKI